MTFRSIRAVALCLGVAYSGTTLPAQAYRQLDGGRNVVTLPSATGLPTITSITAAPGAGFSILHSREGNIHQFDGNGRLVRRIGRASDSTVKMERMHQHGWHGQLPWVHEQNSREVLVFDGVSGKVSTVIDLPRLGGAMQARAITPSGALIVYHYFRIPGATPQHEFGYGLMSGFGISPKVPFAKVPLDECFLRLGDQRVQVPWCQPSHGAVAPNGEWVAVVSEAQNSAAGSSAVRVTFYSTRGDTLSSVRIDAPAVPVAPATLASHLASEARSRRLTHDNTLKLRAAVPAAPHYPLAAFLIATNDRTLWLVQPTATATRYVVVSSDGRVVGRYATAPNLQLMAAAGRVAFGVRTLPSGAQQVVRVGF